LSNGFVARRPFNYRDAYGVAVGAEMPLTETWSVRGGVHYDTTPTTDAWRDTVIPDSNRVWIGAGATYNWSSDVAVDVGYNHLFFERAPIALTRVAYAGTPAATPITINATAHNAVDNLSVTIRKRF
jgi:long-chain fatty acid transport protein